MTNTLMTPDGYLFSVEDDARAESLIARGAAETAPDGKHVGKPAVKTPARKS